MCKRSIDRLPFAWPNWGPSPDWHVPWPGIEPGTFLFTGWDSVHWATPARVPFLHNLMAWEVILWVGVAGLHSFSVLYNIPLCKSTQRYWSVSTDGHLGCFQFFPRITTNSEGFKNQLRSSYVMRNWGSPWKAAGTWGSFPNSLQGPEPFWYPPLDAALIVALWSLEPDDLAKWRPDSWPMETEKSCFKPLCFGAICYRAIGNTNVILHILCIFSSLISA